MLHAFKIGGEVHEIWLARTPRNYEMHHGTDRTSVTVREQGQNQLDLEINSVPTRVHVAIHGDEVYVHLDGEAYTLNHLHNLKRFASQEDDRADMVLRAPMPGAVISVAVHAGQAVQRGDVLVVIESMKMETAICATVNGVVQEVLVQQGQTFERDAILVRLSEAKVAA